MSDRRKDSLALAFFGDALREALGLEPLYQSGRAPQKEAERFYQAPFTFPSPSMRSRD